MLCLEFMGSGELDKNAVTRKVIKRVAPLGVGLTALGGIYVASQGQLQDIGLPSQYSECTVVGVEHRAVGSIRVDMSRQTSFVPPGADLIADCKGKMIKEPLNQSESEFFSSQTGRVVDMSQVYSPDSMPSRRGIQDALTVPPVPGEAGTIIGVRSVPETYSLKYIPPALVWRTGEPAHTEVYVKDTNLGSQNPRYYMFEETPQDADKYKIGENFTYP